MRVVDFGLARAAGAPQPGSSGESPTPPPGLTATGRVHGTPAYMAPEQAAREPVDARCDQYSWCVALYEALAGHRPFRGESLAELAQAVATGQIEPPPEGTQTPEAVWAVLRWHEHHCVAKGAVQCPDGYSQHDRLGCEPDAKCTLDTTAQIAPQVAGACERGDAACCPMEGRVHQVEVFRAKKAGDAAEVRREDLVMQALYERACEMGHASLCAFVAERLDGETSGDEATPKAGALSARACALGHWASCP